MKPMTAINAPPPPSASSVLICSIPDGMRPTMANKNVSTIATPPPLGVGTVCELRALGTSITLRASA
ncbi:hypothetical protein D3C76_1122890 [compost metagenome]